MAKKPIQILKEYFKVGKRPTESQFEDFIDSFAHLDGPELEKIIENVNSHNGYLQFTSQNGNLVTQISFQDIRNNMNIPQNLVQSVNGQTGNVTLNLQGSTDIGSTREGIAKFTTYDHSTTNIFHIKLPYRINIESAMFHIKALGYNYGGADIIDVTWVGYCYQAGSSLISNKTNVVSSTAITAGQYVGSDSHIYLWFKVPNTYFTTFRIDSMRVGNGTLLQEGDVQIIMSPQNQL